MFFKQIFCQNFFYFFKQNFFLLFFKQNIWVSKSEKTRGIRLSVALRGDATFVPVTLRDRLLDKKYFRGNFWTRDTPGATFGRGTLQNWDKIPSPLLGPQNFFRLQRAENLTRFQEMYINWDHLLYVILIFKIISLKKSASIYDTSGDVENHNKKMHHKSKFIVKFQL